MYESEKSTLPVQLTAIITNKVNKRSAHRHEQGMDEGTTVGLEFTESI